MRERMKSWLLPILAVISFFGLFLINQSTAEAADNGWSATSAGTELITAQNVISSNAAPQTTSSGASTSRMSSLLGISKSYGGIQIIKYDKDTNARIQGAEFTIYNLSNQVIQVIRTNASGIAQTTTLPLGMYKVKETAAPAGYKLEDSYAYFTIICAGQSICLTKCNEKVPFGYGLIAVNKTDEQGNPLAGAVFNVYNSSNQLVGTITTNASGIGYIPNLPNGTYKLVEITAPPGYILDATPIYVTITGANTTVQTKIVDVVNKKKDVKGSLEVTKKDETGKALSGAVFDVYNSSNQLVGTITTDASGKASLGNLPYGTYTLIETKAPAGYELDATPKTVIISATNNGIATISVINKKTPSGSLEVTKKDTTGKVLSGAVFDVYNSSNQLVGTITTDASGKASLSNLPYGTYTLIETKAPAGYELDATPKTVIISAVNNGVATIEVINQRISNDVVVIKKDTEGNLLSGAVFGLYDMATSQLVATATTDATGTVRFPNVAAGFYYVKEIEAPAGYVLNTTPQYITVTAVENSTVTVEFVNEKEQPAKGSLKIVKYVKDSDPIEYLAGAVFEVYDSEFNLIGTYTTDANGEILINDLEPGTYYAVELTPPPGYVEDATFYDVIVVAGEVAEIRHPNTKIPVANGTLKVTKYGTGPKGTVLLADAEFKVEDSTGKQYVITTDASGTASVDLPPGEYTVTETVAPEGYMLGTDGSQTVTITENGLAELTFYNEAILARALVYVTSASGQSVSGVNFIMTNTKTDETYEVATNSLGQISTYLPLGEYKIEKAPTASTNSLSAATIELPTIFTLLENKLSVIRLTID